MTLTQLKNFLTFLKKRNIIYAPQVFNGEVIFKKVDDVSKVKLTKDLPLYSFKQFVLPPTETLFDFKKEKVSAKIQKPRQILFGLTVPDLRALTLLNQVFSQDAHFQEIKKKTIVIGYFLATQKEYQKFIAAFKENVSEHLEFDIFLLAKGSGYEVYSGSEDGQRLLDQFGYSQYKNIQYVGPIREEGLDLQLIKIRKKMKKSRPTDKIWRELGKRCIECGKCSIVCPTCFCFGLDDQIKLDGKGKRERFWDSCFYSEFSEITGNCKFLKTTAERIHFWYEHKFVRIPDEFSVPGCVGCGRCVKVCPAGIDIRKVLKRI